MRYYRYMFIIKMKEAATYRVAFINNLLAQLFAYLVTLININLLLSKIGSLNGWDVNEILLLWALNVFSYGITGLFIYTGCNKLESELINGKFDIYLSKPRSVFWNYMFHNLSPVFILHIGFSSILLGYVFSMNEVRYTFLKVLYILVLLICAVCVQSCIMVILGSVSFWWMKSGNIVDTAIYGLRNFTTYPLSIYGKGIKFIMIFIIPYAFVSYFPALYILDKVEGSFETWMVILEPFITLVFLGVTWRLWTAALKRYNSAGNYA